VPTAPSRREPDVEIVYERAAGIDVGKKIIAVAVRSPGERPGKRRQQLRKYNTFHQTLTQMVAWLVAEGITHVTMEATGSTGSRSSMPYLRQSTHWRCCWSTPGTSRTSPAAKVMPSTRRGWRS
jgi:hypothetical protein